MKYTVKVWIFTILISPILLLLLWCISSPSQIDSTIKAWPIIFYMIPFGLVLSSPAILFFGLIQREISNKVTNFNAKNILSLYSFLYVWITFYILEKNFVAGDIHELSWAISYSLTIVIGVWIFKLKKDDNNKIDNQNKSK